MPRQKGRAGGGRRRPPTRGRPREPETQADTQDNTQPPAQPPAPPRASPAWLAAHFENVARRPQPTSERSGYETVRVVAARDADAENQGGGAQDQRRPPHLPRARAADRGRGPAAREHGRHAPPAPRRARRRRPDARAAAARPGRGRAAVFGLALTCADLEPVDNAAIEADDEQRPDVDADGHVSALLRASAGRATLRAAAATLDEHQPGGAAATEDAGLLGMDVAPLRALVAAVAPAPAPARRIPRRSPARRATPAPAPTGTLAGAPDAAELAAAPPDAADAGLAAAAPAAAPHTPRVPPTPGLDAPMRATAERLVAEQRAAEAADEAEDEEWLLLARGARARAVARAAPAPAPRRPRARPRKQRSRAPSADADQHPAAARSRYDPRAPSARRPSPPPAPTMARWPTAAAGAARRRPRPPPRPSARGARRLRRRRAWSPLARPGQRPRAGASR